MADDKSARDNSDGAPLLPGGEPELAGTGPHGAYPEGSPLEGESDAHNPEGFGGRRVGHLEGNESTAPDDSVDED